MSQPSQAMLFLAWLETTIRTDAINTVRNMRGDVVGEWQPRQVVDTSSPPRCGATLQGRVTFDDNSYVEIHATGIERT